jgi:hypothetical protein
MDRLLDPDTSAQEALAREMHLIDSLVAMVADGHAARMHVGGLAYGDALLDYARRTAGRRGVRVIPVWGVGEEGLALTFERPGDPAPASAAPDRPNARARGRRRA